MFVKRFATLVAVAAVLTLSPLGAQAKGKNKFDDKTIKGTYALSVEGAASTSIVIPGVPPDTQLWAVATITFDGDGGCWSIDQIVVGGIFIPARDEFRDTRDGGDCTYSVNKDGTGLFDVTFPGAPPTNVTFVIVDRNVIRFIANNPGLGIFGGGVLERR